jgi:hypothetical protein
MRLCQIGGVAVRAERWDYHFVDSGQSARSASKRLNQVRHVDFNGQIMVESRKRRAEHLLTEK